MRHRIWWLVQRIAVALVAAAALVVVTAIELSASGGLDTWALILLAVVVGVLGPAESVVRAIKDFRGDLSFNKKLNVEEAAKLAIVALTKVAPEVQWTQIGVTVFVVRRTIRHPKRGVQQRVCRIRMESTPRPSTVLWTWEKGILGECWKEERDVALDHRATYAPHMDVTEKQWDALDNKIRRKLSFHDFKDIREYGLVLASPMKDHHGYHGCFVVQVPSELGDRIQTPDALEVIHTVAGTTCAVICR